MFEWHDIVGTVGVLLVVGTYFAIQTSRIQSRQPSYSILNGVGAGLILVSLCFDFNLSAFLIEMAWVVISVFGLFQSYRSDR